MNLFLFVRSAHSCIIERLPEYDNILLRVYFLFRNCTYMTLYIYTKLWKLYIVMQEVHEYILK
jgi:hypothetical protein